MATLKEVRNEIYNKMSSDADLSSQIKEFVKGIPPLGKFKSYPVLCVKWIGGTVENKLGSSRIVKDRFGIVIVSKFPVSQIVEDQVMDLVKEVEDVIYGSTWTTCSIYAIQRGRGTDMVEGDYSIVSVTVIVETRRKESS